ncbi:hypothetical protein ACSBR2_001090 [Camellia fascicularis]
MSRNNLTGSIPTSIQNLANLTISSLYENQLSGSIPEEVGLLRLRLDRNKLVANISKDFGVYPNLNYIDLSYNHLYGELSPKWGLFHNLTSLKISHNNISGRIPSELGNATQLHVLDLFSNHLVGEIPYNLGKLHSLFDLTLRDNKLFGNIPLEIGSLFDLQNLNLAANKLSGFVPKQNHLEGPLANNKAFQKALYEAFRVNKALCGNNFGLKACPPKMSDGAKGKKHNKFVILVIVLVSYCQFFSSSQRAMNEVKEPSPRTKENLFEIWSYDGKLVYENIIEATENFNTNHCVGVGGCGIVYRVELPSGQVIAVKTLHNSQDDELVVVKSFMSEIQALREIRHRNIAKLYGFCSHQ